MKKLKILILSWLVFHANRKGKNSYFYKIKNELLEKYGEHKGYDIQFIAGKKCYSCRGTGTFKCDYKLPETCWSCGGAGWFKKDQWNILAVVQLGKYQFHNPYARSITRPDFCNNLIVGYIKHYPTKYSNFALFLLFLLCEKGYLKRWYRETCNGWRLQWYLPKNWIRNIIHILKHGTKSFPFGRFRDVVKFSYQSGPSAKFELDDELPF